jgi:TRAP-type C4-dicarboxylate transport system substrate-binding protein
VFSKRTWDSLSKDDQALVTKLSAEAQQEQRQLWDEREAQAMKKIKDSGIEVITFADKKPFQDAVKPVWDKYGAKYDALVKRIQAVQ